jgi:hypothetical protein
MPALVHMLQTKSGEAIKHAEVPLNESESVFGVKFKMDINRILSGALDREKEEVRLVAEEAMKEEKAKFNDPAFASW